MVEYSLRLDLIFNSLANPTRRDIFQRVIREDQTVGQIAEHYKMSLAAVSKHLKIMEKAMLISNRRKGRQHIVTAEPTTLITVQEYLVQYEKLWEKRLDSLEELLKKEAKIDAKT